MSLNNWYDDWARGDADKALDTQTGKLAYVAMSYAFRRHVEEIEWLHTQVRKAIGPDAALDGEMIRSALAVDVFKAFCVQAMERGSEPPNTKHNRLDAGDPARATSSVDAPVGC